MVLEWFSRMLVEQGIIKEEEQEIYRYGLSNGMVIILNLFTALLIGIFSGQLLSVVTFTLFFMMLRSYSSGYHSDSRVVCYLVSSAVLMIPVYTSEVMSKLPTEFVLVILFVASTVIYFLSPLDSPKRKLDAEEKKHFGKKARRILFVELLVFGMLYGLRYYELAYAGFCSMWMIATSMLLGKVILKMQLNIEKDE